MKKVFKFISVCGFILAFNTVSMCDYQLEIGLDAMTEFELYTRLAIACMGMIGGFIGTKVYNHIDKVKACRIKRRTVVRNEL